MQTTSVDCHGRYAVDTAAVCCGEVLVAFALWIEGVTGSSMAYAIVTATATAIVKVVL
jgi:hypothetical protein